MAEQSAGSACKLQDVPDFLVRLSIQIWEWTEDAVGEARSAGNKNQPYNKNLHVCAT